MVFPVTGTPDGTSPGFLVGIPPDGGVMVIIANGLFTGGLLLQSQYTEIS